MYEKKIRREGIRKKISLQVRRKEGLEKVLRELYQGKDLGERGNEQGESSPPFGEPVRKQNTLADGSSQTYQKKPSREVAPDTQKATKHRKLHWYLEHTFRFQIMRLESQRGDAVLETAEAPRSRNVSDTPNSPTHRNEKGENAASPRQKAFDERTVVRGLLQAQQELKLNTIARAWQARFQRSSTPEKRPTPRILETYPPYHASQSHQEEIRAAHRLLKGSSIPKHFKEPIMVFMGRKAETHEEKMARIVKTINDAYNANLHLDEKTRWDWLLKKKELQTPYQRRNYWTYSGRIPNGPHEHWLYEQAMGSPYRTASQQQQQVVSSNQAVAGPSTTPGSDTRSNTTDTLTPEEWKQYLYLKGWYHDQRKLGYGKDETLSQITGNNERIYKTGVRLENQQTQTATATTSYESSQPQQAYTRTTNPNVYSGQQPGQYPYTSTPSSTAYQKAPLYSQPSQPYPQNPYPTARAYYPTAQPYDAFSSSDVPASYGQQETGLDRTQSHPYLVQVWDFLSNSKDYFIPVAQRATSQGRLKLVDSSNLPNPIARYYPDSHTIFIPLMIKLIDGSLRPRTLGDISEKLFYELHNASGRSHANITHQHLPPPLGPTASLEERDAYAFQIAITALAKEWHEWKICLEVTLRSQAINSDPNMGKAGPHIDVLNEKAFENIDQDWFYFSNYLRHQVRNHTIIYDPTAANPNWIGWRILHNKQVRDASRFSITQEVVDRWKSDPRMEILPTTDNPFL